MSAEQAGSFAALATFVQAEVDARLAAVLDAEGQRAARLAPEVSDMVSALSDLCRRGGKRLRPTLLLAGALAVRPRVDVDVLLDAGVALELLQAYFLIHDDWMDGDAVRRGGPSVHTILTRRFGDRHIGAAGAILAGDYALALATTVLSELAVAPRLFAPMFGAFARMQRAAVAGQQIDIVARSEDVEKAYALKTASYTVHGPLELGALLARGSSDTLATLARFARPLGVAFQLRDDLLSAFGEAKATGKPFGNDIKAGKRTVLLLNALARATPRDRRVLTAVVGNARANEEEVRAVLAIFERTGARAQVERRVAQLSRQALRAVQSGTNRRGRALLSDAVAVLTERRS